MTSQYYDSENISESRLSFRRATAEPETCERRDTFCMGTLYGMDEYVIHHRRLPNPVS